jgi:Transposase
MSRAMKRGPGPSHVLMTPDHAGNVVGIDPHKRTLTATVADARGGILASAHFRVSGEGHRELEAWARQFGQIARWGIEGAASWGRHTAMFLAGRGHDVRDVCANRTPRSDRARQRGTSDMLDSERIAREVLAHSLLPKAFKRAGQEQGPDEQHQLLALWNNRRRSILTGRQHLVGEAEYLLCELPLELREQLPDSKAVRTAPGGARAPQPPPALRRADEAAPAAARRLPGADQGAGSRGEAGGRATRGAR